ncbi:MAG: carboxypeptidase-like regulatory domain-containing protein [Pedobacter sp.]|nr:MAG: carboxypeptidase-like regulatory domain-containing protein [Pedobacter sp.]
MTSFFRILFLIIGTMPCWAYGFQTSYTISGTVKDKKGEALPGANVLLSGYQIGAVANNEGKYLISNLKPGNYVVLVQMMGYLPASVNVTLNDNPIVTVIVLTENTRQLKEVVIRPDPNRSQYLQVFRDSFIGTSPNAEETEIINPSVIRFDYDAERRILQASADEFIILENKVLGYRIKYLLKYFEKDDRLNLIRYYGNPSFEDLAKSDSKARKFKEKRDEAYFGSSQHFLTALFNNTSKKEGFSIYKMERIRNPNRLPDSVLDNRIKFYSQLATRGIRVVSHGEDSLKYFSQMKLSPDTIENLTMREVSTDTLVKKEVNNLRWMNYRDKLYVIYSGEKQSIAYSWQTSYKVSRPPHLKDEQVSIIHQPKNPVAFYQYGVAFEPGALLFEGYWGYEKVADMVPVDYRP